MLKRASIFVILCTSLFLSSAGFSQESSPQVLYIPGMPAPPVSEAPAPEAKAENSTPRTGQSGGKISKVTRSGDALAATRFSEPASASSPSLEAEYKGVTPPRHVKPDNSAIFVDPKKQLTWIGFLFEDKEHKVFIQSSESTTYSQLESADAGIIILKLSDLGIKIENNRRMLDMRYFNTPFKSAQAQKKGKDVLVRIEIDEKATYRIEQTNELISVIAVVSAE